MSFDRRIGALPKSADDPTKGLQYRNPEKPRDRYVTDEELDKIIAKASPKLGCIARFIELTGMRQGDALRVRMEDLDDDGFTYWNSKSKKWQGLEWSQELTTCVENAETLWRRIDREWLFESRPKGKHAKRGIGPYTLSNDTQFHALTRHPDSRTPGRVGGQLWVVPRVASRSLSR